MSKVTLGVSNFRKFRDEVQFDLERLTLFTGYNSSGKSTALKLLTLMSDTFSKHHGFEVSFSGPNRAKHSVINDKGQFLPYSGGDIQNVFGFWVDDNGVRARFEFHATELNGAPCVYLSSLEVHRNETLLLSFACDGPLGTDCEVSLRFNKSLVRALGAKGKGQSRRRRRLELEHIDQVLVSIPHEESVESMFSGNEVVLRGSWSQHGIRDRFLFNYIHNYLQRESMNESNWQIQFRKQNLANVRDVACRWEVNRILAKMSEEFRAEFRDSVVKGKLLEEHISHLWSAREKANKPEANFSGYFGGLSVIKTKASFRRLVSKWIDERTGDNSVSMHDPFRAAEMWEEVQSEKAIDQEIQREHFELDGADALCRYLDEWIGKLFTVVHLRSRRMASGRLIHRSDDLYEDLIKGVDPKAVSRADRMASKFMSKWMKELGVGNSWTVEPIEGEAVQVLIRKGQGEISLADLAMGEAQLFLVLHSIATALLKARRNPRIDVVLILEEPDSNLHPNTQVSLLGPICEALSLIPNLRIALETHSEYLVRMLCVMIKENKLNKDEVLINYLSADHGEVDIEQIRINSDGLLDKDFKTGYLDMAFRLTERLWV